MVYQIPFRLSTAQGPDAKPKAKRPAIVSVEAEAR
jgi:hypothetical protein